MLEVAPFIIGDVFFILNVFFYFSLCPMDRSWEYEVYILNICGTKNSPNLHTELLQIDSITNSPSLLLVTTPVQVPKALLTV